MDRRVLDNGAGYQPSCDPYVVEFSMMKAASELVPPSASYVGLSYLVYPPEDDETSRQPRVPTTTDSTQHHRCWRNLHLHAHCGLDLLLM